MHWLSASGVEEVRQALKAQIDGMPLEITKQVLTLMSQTKTIFHSVLGDGGVRPTDAESAELKNGFTSLVSRIQQAGKDLLDKTATLELIQSTVDQQTLANSAAPEVCKELAFDKFNVASASTLITLGKLGDSLVISQPVGRLLSAEPFRIALSKDSAQENAGKVPSGLAREVFVCKNEKKEWSLSRAADLPAEQGVVFCAGSACKGDEFVRISSDKAKLMDMGDAMFVQMW